MFRLGGLGFSGLGFVGVGDLGLVRVLEFRVFRVQMHLNSICILLSNRKLQPWPSGRIGLKDIPVCRFPKHGIMEWQLGLYAPTFTA